MADSPALWRPRWAKDVGWSARLQWQLARTVCRHLTCLSSQTAMADSSAHCSKIVALGIASKTWLTGETALAVDLVRLPRQTLVAGDCTGRPQDQRHLSILLSPSVPPLGDDSLLFLMLCPTSCFPLRFDTIVPRLSRDDKQSPQDTLCKRGDCLYLRLCSYLFFCAPTFLTFSRHATPRRIEVAGGGRDAWVSAVGQRRMVMSWARSAQDFEDVGRPGLSVLDSHVQVSEDAGESRMVNGLAWATWTFLSRSWRML